MGIAHLVERQRVDHRVRANREVDHLEAWQVHLLREPDEVAVERAVSRDVCGLQMHVMHPVGHEGSGEVVRVGQLAEQRVEVDRFAAGVQCAVLRAGRHLTDRLGQELATVGSL